MENLTGKNGWSFRKTMAIGLFPLLLLAISSGCTARHMPYWSEVESVVPETKTEVQLYEDEVPLGGCPRIDYFQKVLFVNYLFIKG